MEILRENKKRIIIAIVSLLVLLVFIFGAYGITEILTEKNDKKAAEALSGITYTEDTAEDELAALEPYTESGYLSVEQQGLVFKAMAELSYMTGDDMVYNKNIASALYYLRRAKDISSVVYLSNKYIGKLYANGCYASAEKILEGLAEDNKMSSLSAEINASYYLSCADVAQMQDKEASEALAKANAAILLMEDDGNKLLCKAKYDLLNARKDIMQNDFSSAEKRLESYSYDDNFGFGENQVYVVCDFQIPFYEIMAKIHLHNGDTEAAFSEADKYISLCDSFKFRAMKLRLIQYVVANSISAACADNTDRYRKLERSVSHDNLSEMTDEYGQFMLTNLDDVQGELEAADRECEVKQRNVIIIIALFYVAILLYCAVSIFLKYINRDGLTHLNNRKQYEEMRSLCEKKKIPYCLLMIDIDDFKKVNDTYGHAKGDEVLHDVAAILRQYTKKGVSAYRYGGEEMCLIGIRTPEQRARQIAEEIREKIENMVCGDVLHITVSGGIGVSVNGENVFQQADSRLYESKKNGKNQIR